MWETAESLTPEATTDPGLEVRQDFRDAMATLASGVCVVAARTGELRHGRTVTAALSLGVDPPAILVSIDAGAALAGTIRASGGFSVALLADTQKDVAEAFAGRVPAADRFDHGDWRDWPSGQPRLGDSVASLDCSLRGAVEIDSHILFVGAPRAIDRDGGRAPLVWHDRQFAAVQPISQD